VSTLIQPHRARARSGGSSERQPGRLFTASTGLSPDGGLQASHTAQGSRSASGSADGTTSRWVMEKAGENAPYPPFWTALKAAPARLRALVIGRSAPEVSYHGRLVRWLVADLRAEIASRVFGSAGEWFEYAAEVPGVLGDA
jgi:hypothetical protein